jgi:glc operon protein GlcG
MKSNFNVMLASAAVMLGSLSINAAELSNVINLDLAQKIAAGCQTEAQKHGWKMSVTVVDAGANAVYFQRMDGAYIASADISKLKAENSAKMQLPTSAFEEFAFGKDKKGGPAPGLANLPGFVTIAGGLPIKSSKAFLGAVGVSGGFPNEDEACAQAGLEAVKSSLK